MRRDRERALRGLAPDLARLVRAVEVVRELAELRERVAAQDRRIVWRARERLLEQIDRFLHVRDPPLVVFVPRAQIEIDRDRIGRRFARGRGALDGERLRDRVRRFVADGEEVLLRRVEALRPKLKAVGDADESRVDAQLSAHLAHAAIDDDLHVELAPSVARIAIDAFVLHDGAARAHAQPARHRQCVDQIVGQSLREVIVLGLSRVSKREHRDRLCLGLDALDLRRRHRTRRLVARERRVERARDVLDRRVPVRRLSSHAFDDDVRHRVRQARSDRARARRRLREPRRRDREHRVAVPRPLSRDHLVEHRAERVHVRARVDLSALDLFGRHVRRRADRQAARHDRELRVVERSRDPEIAEHDAPALLDEHVVRLEIAVHDARRVRRREPRADRARERGDLFERRLTLGEERRERLAVDVLHRQELLALVLADVEHARDVLVRHAPRELHLLAKALEHPRRVDELLAEHLQRDDLVELRIACTIHASHPADAYEPEHRIAPAESLRRERRRRLTRRRDGGGRAARRERGLLVAANLRRVLAHDHLIVHRTPPRHPFGCRGEGERGGVTRCAASARCLAESAPRRGALCRERIHASAQSSPIVIGWCAPSGPARWAPSTRRCTSASAASSR